MDSFEGRARWRTRAPPPLSHDACQNTLNEAHDALKNMRNTLVDARTNLQGAFTNLQEARKHDKHRRQ